MDNRLIALKLVLDELGIPADISTLDDRKKVQKTVYLGQISGLELGYRFGWYLLGPYSPDLTRDYYSLASSMEADDPVSGHVLRPEAKAKLQRVRPLTDVPPGIELEQEDWLELLASLHYLRKVSGFSYDRSVEAMGGTSKERLLSHAARAEHLLTDAHLL